MQTFEMLFLLATTILLAAVTLGDRLRQYQVPLFGISCALLAFHLLFEVSRWQMSFAYLVFLISALFLLKRSTSHIALRVIGLVLGLLLLSSSFFLSTQLPILTWPPPGGPYNVGTTAYTLTDSSRKEPHIDEPGAKRELFVEVWYPAASSGESGFPQPKTLWQELYTGPLDQVSFFLGYLKGIKTYSYPDIPADLDKGPYPVVLFNHGLQMFTSQNTLLMEHLASHGYVLVSIAHPYESLRVNLSGAGTVLPVFIHSFEEFNKAMVWVEKTSRPVLQAIDSTKGVGSREERAAIMLRAIEHSELNRTVDLWVEDTRFVLNDLERPVISPHPFGSVLDLSKVGIIGMSIGGATSAEFCKSDSRCVTGINVDGLQYGVRRRLPLEVPFMMLSSDDGAGVNDFLMLQSRNDYYEYHIAGSKHPDLTDLSLIWPIMKTAGQMGEVSGERVHSILNTVVLDFLNHYLKNEPLQLPGADRYPELQVVVKTVP